MMVCAKGRNRCRIEAGPAGSGVNRRKTTQSRRRRSPRLRRGPPTYLRILDFESSVSRGGILKVCSIYAVFVYSTGCSSVNRTRTRSNNRIYVGHQYKVIRLYFGIIKRSIPSISAKYCIIGQHSRVDRRPRATVTLLNGNSKRLATCFHSIADNAGNNKITWCIWCPPPTRI